MDRKYGRLINAIIIIGLILIPSILVSINVRTSAKLDSITVLSVKNDYEVLGENNEPGEVEITFKLNTKGEGKWEYNANALVSSISNPIEYKDGVRAKITENKDGTFFIKAKDLIAGTYELTINGSETKFLGIKESFPVKTDFTVSSFYYTLKDIKEMKEIRLEIASTQKKEEEETVVDITSTIPGGEWARGLYHKKNSSERGCRNLSESFVGGIEYPKSIAIKKGLKPCPYCYPNEQGNS